MSLTKQLVFTKLCLSNTGVLFPGIRNASHWFKDYKPGQFPKTEEERHAVAKKYELLPIEYKPYPDDGTGYGDYPMLPIEASEARDPNYPWDNPELKRNFNEPMHADYTLYSEDRYNISHRFRIGLRTMVAQTFLVLAGLFGIYYVGSLEKYKFFHALAEKQYPQPGEKHYTFEK